jgi:sterol desaturase/sphingolipid hydroxylase (fatty acid hydroxylase superfamily)
MAILELIVPRRQLIINKTLRWSNNLALVVLNTLILKLIFPVSAMGIAVFAATHGVGVFNILHLSGKLVIIASILILDLAIYFQHRIFHIVPVFWRFHKVHHVDLDYDVTTGLRFHPLEIILSMLIKFGVVLIFGISATAIIVFEIILNATSMFNHGNIRLPLKMDKILRYLLVTPDMHRVHHSVLPDETNSNYGFNLSCWDRLFKTYVHQPKDGHINMLIGLKQYRISAQTQKIKNILLLPFISNK